MIYKIPNDVIQWQINYLLFDGDILVHIFICSFTICEIKQFKCQTFDFENEDQGQGRDNRNLRHSIRTIQFCIGEFFRILAARQHMCTQRKKIHIHRVTLVMTYRQHLQSRFANKKRINTVCANTILKILKHTWLQNWCLHIWQCWQISEMRQSQCWVWTQKTGTKITDICLVLAKNSDRKIAAIAGRFGTERRINWLQRSVTHTQSTNDKFLV